MIAPAALQPFIGVPYQFPCGGVYGGMAPNGGAVGLQAWTGCHSVLIPVVAPFHLGQLEEPADESAFESPRTISWRCASQQQREQSTSRLRSNSPTLHRWLERRAGTTGPPPKTNSFPSSSDLSDSSTASNPDLMLTPSQMQELMDSSLGQKGKAWDDIDDEDDVNVPEDCHCQHQEQANQGTPDEIGVDIMEERNLCEQEGAGWTEVNISKKKKGKH